MSSSKAMTRWLWVLLAALLATLAWLGLSGQIQRWLVSDGTGSQSANQREEAPKPLAPLRSPLDDALVDRLRPTLKLVDDLGRELVRDDLKSAQGVAAELAATIERVTGSGPPAEITQTLDLARDAAKGISGASWLDEARLQLGELNRALFHLGSHAEGLREGYHVFRCPMAPGFPLWFQKDESIANPYMGASMPTCGVRSKWPSEDATPEQGRVGAQGDPDEVAYWTCSMHPSVRSNEPGTCPICSMNLTPVSVRERDEGVLMVDEHRRQLINLRTTTVELAPLRVPIRGYAEVTVAEPSRHAVNLRVEGWIEKLFAAKPGQPIHAGEPLFTLYSPELYSAQDEFLTARGSGRSDVLAKRARERLHLFSLTDAQIDAIAERGVAETTIDILAPWDGYLLAKHVVEGDRVPSGMTVMEIAALDPVWIDVEIFEGDLPLVTETMEVTLELSNVPNHRFVADVDYVYPTLDRMQRAGRVRLVVGNPDLALRPGMHATASVEVDLGRRLLVPREAVVYTGPRRLVFLDIGDGRILPREITVGFGTPTHLEVVTGLKEDDVIVSSGTFLIASESRIRSAETIWRSDDAGH